MQKMVAKFGDEEYDFHNCVWFLKCKLKIVNLFRYRFGFLPQTYVLPHDLRLLRKAWSKNTSDVPWIIKPVPLLSFSFLNIITLWQHLLQPASARGTGIQVIHEWNQLPRKRPLVRYYFQFENFFIKFIENDSKIIALIGCSVLREKSLSYQRY